MVVWPIARLDVILANEFSRIHACSHDKARAMVATISANPSGSQAILLARMRAEAAVELNASRSEWLAGELAEHEAMYF